MIITFLRRQLSARIHCAFRPLRFPFILERIPSDFYGPGEYFSFAVMLRSPWSPEMLWDENQSDREE